jgi:hypothetical protein
MYKWHDLPTKNVTGPESSSMMKVNCIHILHLRSLLAMWIILTLIATTAELLCTIFQPTKISSGQKQRGPETVEARQPNRYGLIHFENASVRDRFHIYGLLLEQELYSAIQAKVFTFKTELKKTSPQRKYHIQW